jgi:hypothetical protein
LLSYGLKFFCFPDRQFYPDFSSFERSFKKAGFSPLRFVFKPILSFLLIKRLKAVSLLPKRETLRQGGSPSVIFH